MDFYDKMCGALPLPACVYDSEKKSILFANHLFTELTGLAEQISITDWLQIVANKLSSGSSFTAEIPGSNNREKLLALVHAKQLKEDNQQPYIITFSLLPEKKTTSETLASNSKKELELLTKESDEFIYAASHDLQEPLRKITTFSGRLAAALGDDLPGDAAMYLQRMNMAADNMRDLINGLLEISRVDRNKQADDNVNLQAVVEDVLQTLGKQVEERNIQVTVENLPTIKAVAVQMQQLFFHIISNAVKFSKEPQPTIHIYSKPLSLQQLQAYHLSPGRTYYIIVVADNGIGFEQQYAEKIFQTFVRLNGKSEYKGHGIGLTVCKKIVDRHHGIIKAEGKENEGSTFMIVLPENQTGL